MSSAAVAVLDRSAGLMEDGIVSIVKACVRKSVGVGAVVLAGTIHAGGLFLPADGVGATADVVHGAKSAVRRSSRALGSNVWERRVRIARQELAVARDDVQNFGSGRLLLNVKDGVDLDVVVERTVPTKWGYSLSGRVAGGNVGFVTLVVHEEAVAGSIWTPESAYELQYLGSGIHALRDVTNAPVQCGGAVSSELPQDDTVQASDNNVRGDGVTVVDKLVVWPAETEERHGGGEAGMLAQVDLHIAYTNDVFERSGALVLLNLVGAQNMQSADFLAQYTDVEQLRNDLGADIWHELRPEGIGRIQGQAGSESAWSVFWSSSTFAHETGHILGIGHSRLDDLLLPYRLRQGLFEAGRFSRESREVVESCALMAGCRTVAGLLPSFSSPWRYDPRHGRPLGVTRFAEDHGHRGPADAVLTINRERHRVAALRPSRNGSQ